MSPRTSRGSERDYSGSLRDAQTPNQKEAAIDKIIEQNDEVYLVNAIAVSADYPKGVRRLVDAIIAKQESEGDVRALVWLLEKSTPVKETPRLKYKVVRSILNSGNTEVIEQIAAFPSVMSVPLLVKALKKRDVSIIDNALSRFESSSR